MAVPVAVSSSIYASFRSTVAQPYRFHGYSWTGVICFSRLRLCACSRLHSSKQYRLHSWKPSGTGGFLSPENNDVQYELQHGLSPQRWNGVPVFVKLPVDTLNSAGHIKKRKALAISFRALALAGVEGIVMEVWWGLVEKNDPRAYDWEGYLDVVSLARSWGLKVRTVMAFHQCGFGPGDPYWIPLPCWICDKMNDDSDLAYLDRLGRRNLGYISLGCDLLPVLDGRSPIQAYSDFMKSFRDTFKSFLGVTVTGIQVGMGPSGQLSYPLCTPYEVPCVWESCDLENVQVCDKYMLPSLNACANEMDMNEWGFERNNSGSFLKECYSKMILQHGERLCKEAKSIFRGTKVSLSAKVPAACCGVQSIPSIFSNGNLSIFIRDQYIPVISVFGRHAVSLSMPCSGRNKLEGSSLEFFKQIILSAAASHVPLELEDSVSSLDDSSVDRVLELSKVHADGIGRSSFSLNLARMDRRLFEYNNWTRFTRFMRQMSGVNNFKAKLGTDEGHAHSTRVGIACVYH